MDKLKIKKESGQVIVVLLLTMLGALVIAIAVTQRSISDVATSTQTEQASRAFSAAEAGLEKITTSGGGTTIPLSESDLGNQTSANARLINSIPRDKQALEYPPIGKETVAQFWMVTPHESIADLTLARYNDNSPITSGGYEAYRAPQVDVYFGNYVQGNDSDTPAIELNVVTKDFSIVDPCTPAPCNAYKSHRYFIDPLSARRTGGSGFSDPADPRFGGSGCGVPPYSINTSNATDAQTNNKRDFRCKVTVPPLGDLGNEKMILIRARILYSNNNQRIAVAPRDNLSLPHQATIYTSTGTSGQSQKTIQIFQLDNLASPFFDFALFSAGSINKQ